MSQRLHIGQTDNKTYDCVLSSEHDVRSKLRKDWLCCEYKMFIGPWKIFIGDVVLFRAVEPVIASTLAEIGTTYPDDIWVFVCDSRTIEHPTQAELDAWLAVQQST